jgi:predicted alpha/beta superfamily hydrolase
MRFSWCLALLSVTVGVGGCHDGGTSVDAGAGDGAVQPDVDLGGGDASEPKEDMALNDTGLTTLRVHYPAGAHPVSVRGDALPLDWGHGISMTAGADDTWEYAVTLPSSVAQVEWKPLLDDGTWSIGPNFVAKRGQTVDVYPHFFNHAGTVSKLFASFHSTTLSNDRAVWLYLPPSYAENTRATYPVLYMHDGQNLFDAGAPWGGWHVQDALDAGAEDGSIREVIVVGPENAGLAREWEYTPDYDSSENDGGGGDKYLTFLVDELKPKVDAMLRTRPGRATTGVVGSSLGGLISAYAGVTRAASFGLVGAMSPSTWWNSLSIVDDVAGMTSPRPDRVYVDYGDGDDGGEDTIFLVQKYLAIGYVEGTSFHSYVQPGGQHQENYWAQRFPGAAKFLFGPRTP